MVDIPEQPNKKVIPLTIASLLKHLDILGFSIFAPAVTMFLLAVEWGGNKFAWSSATIIGLFCGSAAMVSVFGAWEHYNGDNAMIPRSIVRQKIILCGCGTVVFQMGSLLLLTYFLPVWFQVILDAKPIQSGVDTLPTMLSQVFGAVVPGVLSEYRLLSSREYDPLTDRFQSPN